MNKFKYKSFLAEFSFLEELCGGREPLSIQVRRITSDLLKTSGYHYTYDSNWFSRDHGYIYYVVSDGRILGSAIPECDQHFASRNPSYSQGETILEALDRLGASNETIVVEKKFDYDSDTEEQGFSIVIYKPAKDFSLQQAITTARREAEQQVKDECNF